MALHDSIRSLLEDQEYLISQLQQDPMVQTPKGGTEPDLLEIQKKDELLVRQLRELNSLKTVADLVKECSANLGLLEYENAYYSLQNLRKKLKENGSILCQSFRLEQSINTHVDSLHLQLVEGICRVITKGFWHLSEREASFQPRVEWQNDLVEYDYETFMEFIDNVVFSGGVDTWLIEDIKSNTLQSTVSEQISHLYTDYCQLSGLCQHVKDVLFLDTHHAHCSDAKITFTTFSSQELSPLDDLENILKFMNNVMSDRDLKVLLPKIGNVITKELQRYTQKNLTRLIQDSSLKQSLENISVSLSKLSSRTDTVWVHRSTDIERLLTDDPARSNIYIDTTFDKTFDAMRAVFRNTEWQNLSNISKRPATHTRSASVQSEATTWSWGQNDDDDADASGWNDEWAVDIDTDETKTAQVTQLPAKFLELLQHFDKECKLHKDEEYYSYKRSLLQTSFFVTCTPHYEDWSQMYIDMRHILQSQNSLEKIRELNLRYLHNQMSLKQSHLLNLLSHELALLQSNKSIHLQKIIDFMQDDIFKPLRHIGGMEGEKYMVSSVKFCYFDCIVARILSWNMISEQMAEDLSRLIYFIWTKTEMPELNQNKEYRELHEKFGMIGKMLPLHLKEIMDIFYAGDFYLFETEELIQWLVLLFADTDLRQNAITDIREIREAAKE